jgi:LuxR family maltose regulon positive regulatory protein
LDSFSGDLCDALLQLEAGACGSIIERLVKTNSFIISMDSSRQWYRYHHLFRDLLRQRLEYQTKSALESLHRRAGLWFKSKGREQEAIHHLLKANAMEEAAALIECKWAEMDMQLQSASWLDMAKKLPSAILERSPVLTMGYGWALLDLGDVEACTGWFDKALRLYNLCLSGARPDDILIHDITQFDLLPATIASAHAYIAAATGDVEGTFTHALYALERIPKDQYSKRSVVDILLALAHWENGDLHEAESVFVRSLKDIQRAANPLIENSYSLVLGELYIQQGSLSKAKTMFEQMISRLIRENLTTILLPGLYLGLAKIAFLQNDNRQAYALLEESKTHGQRFALMDWKYKYYLLLARIYNSEGLYELARDCIRESRMYYYINPIPEDIAIDDVEKQIESAAAQQRPAQPLGEKDENEPAFIKEHANQSLSEPLTVRELEVLSLIVSGLSNQEICDTLFLALSTVKGYNQSIFGKLEVNRRTQAVARAKELGLA